MREGICWRCKKKAWINTTIWPGPFNVVHEEEICADCFDIVGPVKRRAPAGLPGQVEDGSPGQSNAVRALEGE